MSLGESIMNELKEELYEPRSTKELYDIISNTEIEVTPELALEIYKRVYKNKIRDVKAEDILKKIKGIEYFDKIQDGSVDIDDVDINVGEDLLHSIDNFNNTVLIARYTSNNYILLDEYSGEYILVDGNNDYYAEVMNLRGNVEPSEDIFYLEDFDKVSYISKQEYYLLIELFDNILKDSYTGIYEDEYRNNAKYVLGKYILSNT